MREIDLCAQVLELVGDRAEAQATAVSTEAGLTRFANSFIHQNVGEATLEVALKVAVDGRVAAADTTRTDPQALSDLVESTLALAALRPVDADWAGLAPPAAVPTVHNDDPSTRDATPVERADKVRDFVTAGTDLAAAGYVDTQGYTIAFANSAGQQATASATRATVDGIHQSGSSAGKAHQTGWRLVDLDAAAAGLRAADLARRSQDPTDVEPGHYQVVLSPECVATIAIFLAAYGFNAKQWLDGESFAEPGEQQFDAAFTLHDDATDGESLGVPFDAEGTPKARLQLVRDGLTVALAHDRRTARRARVESSGHAVPGGETWGPFPVDLAVAPGGATFEQLVADVDRGLVVTEFNYCRILDPKTQVVTGLTRNGTFLVERGEVVRPVKDLRFTQSFLEALAPGNLLGVEQQARFADCEFGVGIVRAPAMRLADWNFTGGARG